MSTVKADEKAKQRNWEEEFKDIDFGDKRLKDRFFKMMDSFAEAPEESILAAAGSRDRAKAIYRFLHNDSVTFEGVLDSISRATVEKIRGANCETVLLLQDTTPVSFGLRDGIDGMGYYCDSNQKGMNVHSCIAVTESGLPLGLLYQESFTRAARKVNKHDKEVLKRRPIEEKESFRWIAVERDVHEKIPTEVQTIIVCDREGDFYEFFADAEMNNEQFLSRLVQNRLTTEGKRLFNMLREVEAQGITTAHIGRDPRKSTPAREAQMELRFQKIEIKRPARRKEDHLPETLRLTAIYVRELNPPAGEKPAEWFLMTNVSVRTVEDAAKQVRNYSQRWKIERFHFVLKSGCKIEELQARSLNSLQLLILLYSVVALLLLNLTYMGRLHPETPAAVFFDEHEWQTLYRAAHKTKTFPDVVYTLREALFDLAVLAGRKMAPSDGDPGVKTLWKGLMILYTLLTYQEFLV